MQIILDNLPVVWFVLWGLLWAIYFMLDGFDFGLGILRPFIADSEFENRAMHNAAGPFWDGNEVWLITAGGVTFAAFPKAYAVMFSALYAPLLILLFGLIFRAVAFEFRGKEDIPGWIIFWDWVHFLANLIPAVLLGVAFANLFMGIPIDQGGVYKGDLLTLLNPYGLAGGLFFTFMFLLHGALWLAIKSTDKLQTKAIASAMLLWPALCLLLALFLVMTWFNTNIFANYLAWPALGVVPALCVLSLYGIRRMLFRGRIVMAWACSSVFIVSTTFFGVLGIFPNIIISSLDPKWSVTAFNAASSPMTLKIMLCVALAAVPVVLIYQAWVYKTFSFPITEKELEDDHAY